VSNLPRGYTKEQLENKFQICGEISNIICKNDYAIISFDDESCVEGAKMFDETPFSDDDETIIKVEDFIEEFDFENLDDKPKTHFLETQTQSGSKFLNFMDDLQKDKK
jgi:beta-N-acetylglucosaminidase